MSRSNMDPLLRFGIANKIANSLLLFKILIMKNVRSRAYQPEADAVFTRLAKGKSITMEHYGLMGFTMVAVVDYFVDPGLANGFTCAKQWSCRTICAPGVAPSLSAVLGRRQNAASGPRRHLQNKSSRIHAGFRKHIYIAPV